MPLSAPVLVLIVLFGAALPLCLAAGTSCSLSCVNAGQSCNPVVDNFGLHGTGCNGDNYCNNTNGNQGTCVPTPGPGQPCSGVCEPGYSCSGSSSMTCVLNTNPLQFRPGVACTSDNQCYFIENNGTNTHSCQQGKCKFLADGQNCTTIGPQCNSLTSFCNPDDKKCHPYLASGAACNATTSAISGCAMTCAPSATTGSAGTCVDLYSVASGKPCGLDNQCNEGLYCGLVGSGDTFGVCSPVANTSTLYKPCDDSTNCTASNREYCHCFTKYGNSPVCIVDVLPPGYNAANKALVTCEAKCEFPSGDYNTSCLLASCLQEMCAFYKLSNTVSDTLNDCFAQNTLMPLCASSSSSSSTSSPTTPPSSPSPSLGVPLLFAVLLACATFLTL